MTTMRFVEPLQVDNPAGIRLSEAAAVKVKALLEREDAADGLKLRVAVQAGGCSGMKYQLFFDRESVAGDMVSGYDGFEVVVDGISQPFLTGATVDFVDRIDAQGFTVDNPNANRSCSCGDSFSAKECGQSE